MADDNLFAEIFAQMKPSRASHIDVGHFHHWKAALDKPSGSERKQAIARRATMMTALADALPIMRKCGAETDEIIRLLVHVANQYAAHENLTISAEEIEGGH